MSTTICNNCDYHLENCIITRIKNEEEKMIFLEKQKTLFYWKHVFVAKIYLI